MPNNPSIPLFKYEANDWLTEPENAFDTFLSSYRFNQRRLRQSSYVIYKGMFIRLLIWSTEQGISILDLNEKSIENFLDSRTLSPETRHRYLLLFTSLFEHLVQLKTASSIDDSWSRDNPARTLLLERKSPVREEPDFLNVFEVQQFIDALPSAASWKRVRDRAMALVILGAGLRSSEVLSVKVSDLKFKSGKVAEIWVQAKKPRPARSVPIQAWAVPEISEWLKVRDAFASGGAPAYRGKEQRLVGNLLFPADLAGAQLKAVTLFRLVKAALDQAGIVKRYEGPTLLRNSCGAFWLQKHTPLQVSLWMGHATVKTTELLLTDSHREHAKARKQFSK